MYRGEASKWLVSAYGLGAPTERFAVDFYHRLDHLGPETGPDTLMRGYKVRRTPSWTRSWANHSPFVGVSPQECMGQLAPFGPT